MGEDFKHFLVDGVEALSFTLLRESEIDLVLKWRNNEKIRKWMYNDRIISKEEHYRFIESLKDDNSRCYWLVKAKDRFIGVVNLTRINLIHKHAFLGIYANPEEKAKGSGNILMKVLFFVSFEMLELHTLKLEVLENNEVARNFYERHGFKYEGKLKEFVFKDNGWKDVLLMGIREDEAVV